MPTARSEDELLSCLYCEGPKPRSAFNREHVVPDAFGPFEQNLVLHDTVCRACNQHFGDTIDIRLARDSLEGLERYTVGKKLPSSKTAFGRSPALEGRITEGPYTGARAWWGPSEDGTDLVVYPFPQLGLRFGDEFRWFPLEEFPAKADLTTLGFDKGAKVEIMTCGIGSDEARRVVEAKGYTDSTWQEHVDPFVSTLRMHIEGVVDRMLMRAVSKIAFNYLAFHFPAVARMTQFSDIRRFIRYDVRPERLPISFDKSRVLGDVPPGQRPIAHVVTVAWEDGAVVARVALFYRFHYRVVLADGGFVLQHESIEKGHLFDPMNHEVRPLQRVRWQLIRVPAHPA